MTDRTAAARVKRHREKRLAAGWRCVKVWVRNEADAERIRAVARELRDRAAS